MRPQSAIHGGTLGNKVNRKELAALPQFSDTGKHEREEMREHYTNMERLERLKKERRDYVRGKYDKLFREYSCEQLGAKEARLNLEGGIAAFKNLARKEEEFAEQTGDFRRKNLICRFKAWVPDTVVYNELENPFWVYSNEAGVVWRTDQFNQKTITSKLGNFSSSNELVAVLKKSSAPYKTKLLTAKELGFTVGGLSTSGSKGSQACVVQRYIKSIGSKAFKVRTVWSKDAPPYCFIVTNKSNYYEYDGVQDIYKYMTYPAKYGVCTIFRTNKGKQLTDTLPFVENIVKFYRGVYGGAVRNVAGDFIKDESGIWWLVNIKALSVIEEIPKYKFKKVFLGEAEEERGAYTKEHSDGQKPRLRADGYQKIKLCKYCETPYHAEELTKKMTLKMIIELDKHLKYRGMTWDWLDRSEHQYLDISNLYEIHQVCKTCYRLYEEMVELNDNFVRFSELMGVHMKKDRNGQIVSITTLKKPAIEMEEGLADPLELINQRNADDSEYTEDYEQEHSSKDPPKKGYFQQKSKYMSSFRMLMFLQSISEIPIATLQKEPGNYQIEVHLLDQVFKYKIEPQYLEKQSEDMCRINMNRFCMKYFFSEQRASLKSFIQKEKVKKALIKNLKIALTFNGEAKFWTEFELQDFESDQVPTRTYQKYFSVDFKKPSWEIIISLGVHEGKAKDIQGLILHDHKGLIIPAPSYFSYEPLPYSWNKILEDHDVKNPLTKFKQSTKEQGNSFNKEFLLSQGSQSMKKASHKKPPSNMKPMLDLQASKTQSNKKESVLSDLRESKLANKKGDKKFSQSVRKMPVKEEKNPRAVGGLEEGPIRSQRAVKEQDSMNEETNQGKSEENEETEVDSLMMELEEYNPGQYLEVCEQIQRYKVDEK